MTEQVPEPEEEGGKQPRDAAFWAKRVERLEVSDVPEGAANVNVQGRREVGALQGFGKLWQKTDRKSTRLNSSHANISYAVFCLKKKATSSSKLWPFCAASLATVQTSGRY